MKPVICVAAVVCFFGAMIFGLTAMDAYGDWTNLNCAADTACWPTDWIEVVLDGGGAAGCIAGAVALLHVAFSA